MGLYPAVAAQPPAAPSGGADMPPNWLAQIIQALRAEIQANPSSGAKPQGGRFGGGYTKKKLGSQPVEGATDVPVPVLKPGSVDIAQTSSSLPTPYPFPPNTTPDNAQQLFAQHYPGAGGGGGDAQAAPAAPSREDLEKLIFTPPPANFTPAAQPVAPAPQPQIPMGTGPNQGGGRAVASAGSYGGPQPTAMTPPTPGPAAPPMAAPPPYLPPGATFGSQYAQGIDPRILQALAGLTRGRQ